MSDSKNRVDKDRHETVSDEVLENIVGGGVIVGTPGAKMSKAQSTAVARRSRIFILPP